MGRGCSAWLAAFLTMSMACGSGSSNPDAAGFESNVTWCTPLPQLNCHAGEKCTFIVESREPYLGRTDCVPEGTVHEDGACTVNETTGYDDCAAGLFCAGGVCTEICSAETNASCDPDESCTLDPAVFAEWSDVGLCRPACSPASPAGTGCPADEGCYLSIDTGRSACMPPYTTDPVAVDPEAWCDAAPATQGCNCRALNGCVSGYACVLLNDPLAPTGSVCAFLCDAAGSGGPTCADGPGIAFACRPVNEFYPNEVYPNAAEVAAAIGMCVDPAVWP